MGWKEYEAASSKAVTEKRHARQWRDDELRKEEAFRKTKIKSSEDAHKLAVMQIKNSYIEQEMRIDDELAAVRARK